MIQFASEGFKYGESMTHKQARLIIELYLQAKERTIQSNNFFLFPEDFIKKHRLEKRFKGHSFDILTESELIEIDGMNTGHSKINKKINDGLINNFVNQYLTKTPYNYTFWRLQKEEVVNTRGVMQPDCYQYLREHLF